VPVITASQVCPILRRAFHCCVCSCALNALILFSFSVYRLPFLRLSSSFVSVTVLFAGCPEPTTLQVLVCTAIPKFSHHCTSGYCSCPIYCCDFLSLRQLVNTGAVHSDFGMYNPGLWHQSITYSIPCRSTT
jgi:hypothetical protein